MRRNFLLLSLLLSFAGYAQPVAELIKRSHAFHQALITKSADLSSFLDEKLSYGHSGGMLENKQELLEHNAGGFMQYFEFPEDSVVADMDDEIGYLRFVTTIKASMNGKVTTLKLRVLEVWRKNNEKWVLFARQAVRIG